MLGFCVAVSVLVMSSVLGSWRSAQCSCLCEFICIVIMIIIIIMILLLLLLLKIIILMVVTIIYNYYIQLETLQIRANIHERQN